MMENTSKGFETWKVASINTFQCYLNKESNNKHNMEISSLPLRNVRHENILRTSLLTLNKFPELSLKSAGTLFGGPSQNIITTFPANK